MSNPTLPRAVAAIPGIALLCTIFAYTAWAVAQSSGDSGGSTSGGGEGLPPFNNNCGLPFPIFGEVTAFSTLNADTDGPIHAGCQFDGQTYADIWYNYIAICTGTLTVSTCNDADYDTDLVVYDGCECGAGLEDPPLGCNDDDAGCAGFTSEVEVPVVAGNCYKIRVGGFMSETDQGSGNLTVSCPFVCGNGVVDPGEDCSNCPQDVPCLGDAECVGGVCDACPTDINNDGTTNVLDLIDLLLCFGLPAVPGCVAEDINLDGTVNVLDLIDLLLAFGTACS